MSAHRTARRLGVAVAGSAVIVTTAEALVDPVPTRTPA